jgi:hypothetical protein
MDKELKLFISENNLQQRFGLPEYYSEDRSVRLVIIGKSARLDKRIKKNWSTFKSIVVFGPAKRNFRVHAKDTFKKRGYKTR